MNLFLFDDNNIINFVLPYKKIGNFWMTDNEGKNVINISGENNKWKLSASEQTKIISGSNTDEIELVPKNYYIVEKNGKKYVLFSNYIDDNTYEYYGVPQSLVFKVGKSQACDIALTLPYLQDVDFEAKFDTDHWNITKNPKSRLYLNDQLVIDNSFTLKNGDVINIYGFRIFFTKSIIFVNKPYGNIISKLNKLSLKVTDEITKEEIENTDLYQDNDYFLRSPRMRRVIETFNLNVDSPPTKENIQEVPLIMTLGPMLTMGASSLITLSTTLQAVNNGKTTWKDSTPTLVITICMIISMFIWPFVTKWYEKKQSLNREKKRQDKYSNYLKTKESEIAKEFDNQKKIIEESLLPTNVCYDAIINKRRTLWGRRIDQGDFLNVRIGKGEVPFDANISYHTEDFTMDDDNLKQELDRMIKSYETIKDVPISYSFTENKNTAINGLFPNYLDFTNNLLLQIMSYHSYDSLKIAVFTNKKNEKRWKYIKESPYCFSNDKSFRLFATNTEEMQELSEYLQPRFNGRLEQASNNNNDNDFSKYSAYYLIIIDDIDKARKISIIDDILNEKKNLGFSIILLEEKLSKIPSDINKFITIGESTSIILNSDNNEQIRFNAEINNSFDMDLVVNTLFNLPVYMENGIKQLPNTITFLELFGVGQIDQLNVLNRWKNNNPIKSLKTEIGVNENNDPFILDLHEKYHGPHGLIAGMTGSGKSEFIISYILSMAVNYSPEEVAFVLIDYKGGGLAGAFVNSETGKKLPHVVGTITNLDKVEINRALSSIQSELRRRQAKFNEVRTKLNESTIDIYKYQQLYRDGIVREPIPHLIIVCDEFAELKDQQPEFMDDLISTARIGRSLGVHLILATQKPSGVVDGQIWSNSKFKICLKVQDRSDSMEMIKSELAAELKNVGRFYLQVGYNEYFALGQAAWAGAQYYPSKEYKKIADKNIYFISNTGSISNAINNSPVKKVKSEGEELTNIVRYLINISSENDLNLRQLWLDRIPSNILLQDILKKYNYAKERFNINPIIGEYDDPENQMQGLLTLPISKEGNSLIYGTNDSGKDEFLSSLIYSMLMTYDTEELNLYIMDFGAETLLNYQNAPQVGNVIVNGDEEKLENLVKMLNTEMNKRKKLFMSYNGNYHDYIKSSGNSLPNIVVIINAIEVITEVDSDYIDKITPIIREGSKYGIHFVITTTSVSSIRYKVSQSCKQLMCLQMSNETDYRDILGKTNGLVPSSCLGRGLVKLDRVLEFQTAFISSDGNQYDAINDLISKLNEKGIDKARAIPIMPDIITVDKFDDQYLGISTVPIGLTKETLVSSLYDFSKSVINLVLTNEIDNAKVFIPNYIKMLEKNVTFNKVVIDACNYFDDFNYNINLINNDFANVINQLKGIDDGLKDILSKNNMNLRSIKDMKNNLVVIIGISKFYNALDDEHKEMFTNILNSQKELLKINFVFIDTLGSVKKHEYEDWYKNNVDTNNGIWIGEGITSQYTIKLNIQPSGINLIENDYGVIVKNGIPTVVKFINEIK